MGVGVRVGVTVGVGVRVGVRVGVSVGVRVGVAVRVGVTVGVAVRVGVAVMVGVGVWAANVRPGVGRHGDVGSGVGTGGRATALTLRSSTSDPTDRSCVVPPLAFRTRRSA